MESEGSRGTGAWPRVAARARYAAGAAAVVVLALVGAAAAAAPPAPPDVATASAAVRPTEHAPAATVAPAALVEDEATPAEGENPHVLRAQALVLAQRRALRGGYGRWYAPTGLLPNASRRWVFAYSPSGDPPDGAWAPARGQVVRYLYESALSFGGPYRNGRIPLYAQEANLSCEAAALRTILASYGVEASEEEIRARIPVADNPHEGFLGDYHGGFGTVQDYGVYAEPLAGVLAAYGLEARASYGMTYAELDRLVRHGARVIVWLTKWEADEREYGVVERDGWVVARLHGHQHVAVVVGRDAAGRWVLHDPYPLGGPEPGVLKPGQTYTCSVIPNWEAFGNPTDPTAWGRMALVVTGLRE